MGEVVFDFSDTQHATDLFNTITKGEQLLPTKEVPGAVIGTAHCGCSAIGQGVMFRKDSRSFVIATGTTEGRFTEGESAALASEQYKAS